ncbi:MULTISPECIES: reverse transcriptase N-terminal domain-containing protein, partial [Photorhabdus]|uniref:reverse transcriptase N-terminal domain-containing protein n=1 Tax=Photorhabdus TaxID=29487 RepID=UPI001E3C7E72
MKPSEQCNPLTRKVHREVTQLLEASSGRDARLFSGKALAVKRVTENRGKRTAGVDRVTWTTPKSKYQAI